MQELNERPEREGITLDASASFLGLNEISLLSRIQMGEIESVRLRSGEMAIPKQELERLSESPVDVRFISRPQESHLSDSELGIENAHDGLKRNGERSEYKINGHRS